MVARVSRFRPVDSHCASGEKCQKQTPPNNGSFKGVPRPGDCIFSASKAVVKNVQHSLWRHCTHRSPHRLCNELLGKSFTAVDVAPASHLCSHRMLPRLPPHCQRRLLCETLAATTRTKRDVPYSFRCGTGSHVRFNQCSL
jgi:hypothetical protein